MSIFLIVLKRLIKDKLGPLAASLDSKSKSYGYNNELSKDQKTLIDDLADLIVRFDGTDDDTADSAAIIKMLDSTREKVQVLRKHHGEPTDKGETILCLNNLKNHTGDFFKKIAEAEIDLLLDKPYTMNPVNIVYYHAAYYLGDDIFSPIIGSDVKIREKKEAAVWNRLSILSKLVDSVETLEGQKKHALQVLGDLSSDNRKIVLGDGTGYAIPGFSFWGIQATAPAEWFAAGEGRFNEEFKQAVRTIETMTELQFVKSGASAEKTM